MFPIHARSDRSRPWASSFRWRRKPPRPRRSSAGPTPETEPKVEALSLLDAATAGKIVARAEGNGDGRMTVSVTNRRRRSHVVLPPGLIAVGATGQIRAAWGAGWAAAWVAWAAAWAAWAAAWGVAWAAAWAGRHGRRRMGGGMGGRHGRHGRRDDAGLDGDDDARPHDHEPRRRPRQLGHDRHDDGRHGRRHGRAWAAA